MSALIRSGLGTRLSLAPRGICFQQCRNVVNVQSTADEFKANVSKDCLTVAKFSASWCKPCQKSKVFVSELSDEYPNVSFIEVDVDELPQIADEQGVKSIPLFKFFKAGNLLHEHIGGDKSQLEELICKFNK